MTDGHAHAFWPRRRVIDVANTALEGRSHWFVLAFAGACVLGSAYGFLQGTWPFGMVEVIWAVVALKRWVLHANY